MLKFPPNRVTAVILGIMQDGGLPHIGCRCVRCTAVHEGQRPPEYVACLGLVDRRGERTAVWLFDATPDIKRQIHLLADVLGQSHHPDRLRPPDGVFLTHAHMGHSGGLPQLGPEAMAARGMRLYGPARLLALLADSPFLRPLTDHLHLRPILPQQTIQLAPDLRVTAVPVPHRDETDSGAFAYRIDGPARSLLYLPDIDRWQAWPQAEQQLAAVDFALVDATFYSVDELDGRAPDDDTAVVHPLVPHTIKLFARLPGQLILIHINHTNPILDPDSRERQAVLAAGVQIACAGQTFAL